MKRKALFKALSQLFLPLIALLLELSPYGVRLTFAAGPDSTTESFYCYFSLIPFGYATFTPLIAAALTCLVLLLLILGHILRYRKFIELSGILSLAAGVLAILALFVGSYTLIGLCITLLMIGEAFVLRHTQPKQ